MIDTILMDTPYAEMPVGDIAVEMNDVMTTTIMVRAIPQP